MRKICTFLAYDMHVSSNTHVIGLICMLHVHNVSYRVGFNKHDIVLLLLWLCGCFKGVTESLVDWLCLKYSRKLVLAHTNEVDSVKCMSNIKLFMLKADSQGCSVTHPGGELGAV